MDDDSTKPTKKAVHWSPASGQEFPMDEALSMVSKAEEIKVSGESPREILVGWANQQDAWARALAGEVLASGKAAGDEFLDDLYTLFKAEKGLSDLPTPDVPSLEVTASEGSSEEELVLTKLSSLSGVNALADGQEIAFNRGLTILYGENGTGKTGYARVLKRVAGVRTAAEILPNAHAREKQPTPSADLAYRQGDADQDLQWNDELGVSPLTRISVFDSPAVSLHVDDDLNYVFTPADLALYGHVAAGIRSVQEKANGEVGALRSSGNPFLSRFVRGSAIYPVIESLGPATDLSELDRLAALPDEAETRRETLAQEVAALKGSALDERIVGAQQQIHSLTQAVGVLERVAAFDAVEYEATRQATTTISTALREARTELFAPGELLGAADDEWQRFVSAAEHYREHLGLAEYPGADDSCLYCGQHLTEEARRLVAKYRTFLDDSLSRQLTASQQSLDGAVLRISDDDFDTAIAYLGQLAAVERPQPWVGPSLIALEGAKGIAQRSISTQPMSADDTLGDLKPLLAEVRSGLDRLNEQVETLEATRRDRATELANRQRELMELEAKIELNRQLDAVRTYVTNAKSAQKLDQLGRRISNTTLRSLTDASKVASEELINRSFERLFHEECAALRAPSVRLEFQGRSGRAERHKSVASRHKPSAVLSEGECKVLALADFLAECRLRDARAPIIFDDPVTSLDYRRLSEVAHRIASLASEHQVVLFTHSIWLTTELLSMFDSRRDECTFYTVRDAEESKGLVSQAAGPRQDSPQKIGRKIKQLIETAKTADPAVADALVEKGYEHIRSWCETYVEQELLQNVTRRYQPNVMMNNLSKIKVDDIPKAVSVIDPIFAKACRYMAGHSQPLEQLSVRPSVAELEADYAALEALRSGANE